MRAVFREQIDGLLEGGSDLIVLETFSDLNQLVLAVDEARRASDVPVIASLTFGEELRLADGSSPTAAAERPRRGRRGRDRGQLRRRTGRLPRRSRGDGPPGRRASPRARSCRTPGCRSGSTAASSTPPARTYFGTVTPRLLAAGARIVGGCCGTTPEHIAAMRAALDALAAAGRDRRRRDRARHARRRSPTVDRARSLVERASDRRRRRRATADPARRAARRPAASSSRSRSTRRGASGSSGRSRPPGSCATPASTSSTSRTRRWPGSG